MRAGRGCVYCSGPAESVDHVIPLARGGDSYEGNLVPACLSCNGAKSDRLVSEWRHARRAAETAQRQRRPIEVGQRRPAQPPVQHSLAVCSICSELYAPTRRGQVTCGDSHCTRERIGRLTRDRYRAKHGLAVDPSEPTAYWRRLEVA